MAFNEKICTVTYYYLYTVLQISLLKSKEKYKLSQLSLALGNHKKEIIKQKCKCQTKCSRPKKAVTSCYEYVFSM